MIRSKKTLIPAATTLFVLTGLLLFFMALTPRPSSIDDVAADKTIPAYDTGSPLNRSAVLNQRTDGHFWGNAFVNEQSHIDFMVDTGASVIALTPRDAQRIGFAPDTLDYSWTVQTAGGEVKGASVLIDSIRIHQVEIHNVEAMVLQEQLSNSLLGMSYLTKLYSYEFRGDQLIIRQ